MTLKPLGDRVLVKPAPKEEKTSTGLYISSGAQEKPQRGEVVAVGAGKMNDKGERIDRRRGLPAASRRRHLRHHRGLVTTTIAHRENNFGGKKWLRTFFLAPTLAPSSPRA